MTFETLQSAVTATALEGKKSAANHCFVRLASGRWMRTYGLPDLRTCVHVRGRIYHVKGAM